jgi:hypothetical protein
MSLRKTLLIAGVGAALAYYFDPVSGQVRRAKLQRMVNEAVTRGRDSFGTPWRDASSSPVEHESPIVTP